jgi:hypothetical protein
MSQLFSETASGSASGHTPCCCSHLFVFSKDTAARGSLRCVNFHHAGEPQWSMGCGCRGHGKLSCLATKRQFIACFLIDGEVASLTLAMQLTMQTHGCAYKHKKSYVL